MSSPTVTSGTNQRHLPVSVTRIKGAAMLVNPRVKQQGTGGEGGLGVGWAGHMATD